MWVLVVVDGNVTSAGSLVSQSYVSECVCVCMHVCVRACVRACMHARADPIIMVFVPRVDYNVMRELFMSMYWNILS